MYTCPICGEKYESIYDLNNCVNKDTIAFKKAQQKAEEDERTAKIIEKEKELESLKRDWDNTLKLLEKKITQYNDKIREYNEIEGIKDKKFTYTISLKKEKAENSFYMSNENFNRELDKILNSFYGA